MYNYRYEVKEDVRNYINEHYTAEEIADRIAEDRDEFAETLNNEMWVADEVTGNASGSYTFSTYEAEENLCHNWDILEETAEAFGIKPEIGTGYENGAEYWDVTIRCYLLAEMIAEVLEELEQA